MVNGFEIEKDDDETLGFSFQIHSLLTDALSDRCVSVLLIGCRRGCESLWVKMMICMSFLTGKHYVTNLTDDEFKRLLGYRFSPINVSVHATDPDLRVRMLRNRRAGALMDRLNQMADLNIELNTQIVLCPGWNDGAVLDETIADLSTLGEQLRSIAVVPVGLTRYREQQRLEQLEPVSADDAIKAIDLIERWQTIFMAERGTRIVYAADEFYLLAQRPIPSPEAYDGYPQLENGVGMIAEFQEMLDQLQYPGCADDLRVRIAMPPEISTVSGSTNGLSVLPSKLLIATGVLAAPVLREAYRTLRDDFGYNKDVKVVAIHNDFFGRSITVAGLLTGQDLYHQLKHRVQPNRTAVLLSDCMLRSGESVFLDNWTVDELADKLHVPILVATADAQGFCSGLAFFEQLSRGERRAL